MTTFRSTKEDVNIVDASHHHVTDNLDVDTVKDAAQADAIEHKQTLAQAFAVHKKAIFWSMALSAALIMEGYDVVVIGSFYGQPSFLRRFGVEAPGSTNGYVIPAQWQSALSNGSSAGGIIGLLVNGWAADRFGPKIVMMVSIVALTGFIFIFVFANSLTMLVIAEVFCGIPWGVFQTLTTAYASEVCPIQLRGYLTAYVNLCWGCGILLSSGVVKATLPFNTDWSWRLPFALQWMWVVPLFLIVYFAPPSPWWLVRKGRLADAEASVRRLTNPVYFGETEVKNTVAMMQHTNQIEIETTSGTSYVDCFRGIDRRRTEIVMMVFASQLLSGQNLIGQGVQFLQTAGISTNLSFSLNMVLNAMFILGTIFSWGFLGRRTIYVGGMFFMSFVLWIIGGMAFKESHSVTMAIGSLLIALNFIYNCTLGPLCYTIIGEMSSTRLRQKSIALSRIAYQIMNIICGIIVPRMLSPTAWNWGPKSGLFWGGISLLTAIYLTLRLPETKGRSYGELDLLFERKVPAWRFKTTKVNVFNVVDTQELPNDKPAFEHEEIRRGPI